MGDANSVVEKLISMTLARKAFGATKLSFLYPQYEVMLHATAGI